MKPFSEMNTKELCLYAEETGLADTPSLRNLRQAVQRKVTEYRQSLIDVWHLEDIPEINDMKAEVTLFENFLAASEIAPYAFISEDGMAKEQARISRLIEKYADELKEFE